jgi:O-antigen biosynthesis protein
MKKTNKPQPLSAPFHDRRRDRAAGAPTSVDTPGHPPEGASIPGSRLKSLLERYAPLGTKRRWMLRHSRKTVLQSCFALHPVHVSRKATVAIKRLGSELDQRSRPGRIWWQKRCELARIRRKIRSGTPKFPNRDSVAVSIIIPVFNHFRETFYCLESIFRHSNDIGFEVVVVDDASSDRTWALLKRIKGLILVRNPRNLGFIGSCNRGADVARGDYLVFLNNDTTVTPGWLKALMATFKDFPNAGMAGAKLVYPDGRLQEAGGAIWQDASGWNYGKFDDPDHPRYNFAREADYCSGACLIIARALFESLGRFDAHYAPAYYEDTDLAFKVRHAGHRVIYQPHARIIHHEGLTSGRDLKTGVKAHQVTNLTKFQSRWGDRLRAHPAPPQSPVRLVRAHGARDDNQGQVLIIDHRLPTPDRDSGSVRLTEIIRAIQRRGHHVTFIPDNLVASSPYAEDLQRVGVEVIHVPYFCSVEEYLKQHGNDFDLVIIARAAVASRHFRAVKRHARRAVLVFDTVDLHFLREEREAEVKRDPAIKRRALQRKEQELSLARRFDVTLVVSPVEKAILEKHCPGIDVGLIPNIFALDDRSIPEFEARANIVFVGGFEHPPNVDAVLYFGREILPLVRRSLRGFTVQVIGPDVPAAIQDLDCADVQILGYVPDVLPYLDQARLSIAPMRFGAGVKGKVNQSMAHGVPVVVSSMAAEGMHLVHEQNAMIADLPAAFADSITRVFRSKELWERLSISGRANVREHFSTEAASRPVDRLLTRAGLSTRLMRSDTANANRPR